MMEMQAEKIGRYGLFRGMQRRRLVEPRNGCQQQRCDEQGGNEAAG